MGTQVLTAEQARAVRNGQGGPPLTITAYETAIACLRECLEIDDTKYFSDFSAAAEAWAKIHRDETVLRLSRALKLHAAKRMRELAELRCGAEKKGRAGAHSVLLAHGMTQAEAIGARKLTEPGVLKAALARNVVPTLSSIRATNVKSPSVHIRYALAHMSKFLETTTPKEVAKDVSSVVRPSARRDARRASIWLAKFAEELDKPTK